MLDPPPPPFPLFLFLPPLPSSAAESVILNGSPSLEFGIHKYPFALQLPRWSFLSPVAVPPPPLPAPPIGATRAGSFICTKLGICSEARPSRADDALMVFSSPSDALRVADGASIAVAAATTSMAPTHAAMTPYFILRDVAPVSRVSPSTSGVDSSADEARVGIASVEVWYPSTKK